MEISLNKSQEVAHFANDVSQKVSEIASTILAQKNEHDDIMGTTLDIIDQLKHKLNDQESERLAVLVSFISKLIDDGNENFTSILDMLDWSSDKTGKYVIEYQNLARSLGYDVD